VTAAPTADRTAAVADAVMALCASRPVIVADDSSREDEADLIFAAAGATHRRTAPGLRPLRAGVGVDPIRMAHGREVADFGRLHDWC
jgi:hypothetical protein